MWVSFETHGATAIAYCIAARLLHLVGIILSRLDWRRLFERDRRGIRLSRMDAVAGIILSRIAASCRRRHRQRIILIHNAGLVLSRLILSRLIFGPAMAQQITEAF